MASAPQEKPTKSRHTENKTKKTSWTNIFKPWKWRKKKKEKQDKKGQKERTEKKQEEENNVNHVADSNTPPVKPERKFNNDQNSSVPHDDGDHQTADHVFHPSGTTEAEINHPGGDNSKSVAQNDISSNAQINSTVHSSMPVFSNEEVQPPLPPKQRSPEKHRNYRPAQTSRVNDNSTVQPSSHTSMDPKNLNFSGTVETIGTRYNSIPPQMDDSDDSDYDNNIQYREEEEDEDDDEEESSLASKVIRNDSLAFHLSNRPSRAILEERNIIPVNSNNQIKEKRDKVGASLVRRLSERPTKDELEQRNIYKDVESETERRKTIEERKRTLVRKLSFRPTVEQLRERNIIMFNEYVEVIEALSYDRKADKPWTKLTPQDKASIRAELNAFKHNEMAVHDESRQYTRYHKP